MMMQSCAYQQQMRRGDAHVSILPSDDVVCPKPRRVVTHLMPSPLLQPINNQQREAYDAKAGNELLDFILSKGAYGAEKSNFQVSSSPPFFSGSPPSRASNPLIQDEHFVNRKLNPYPPVFEPSGSPMPSPRKSGGGCVRPTPVRRIEGFNCRNNCSISAVA